MEPPQKKIRAPPRNAQQLAFMIDFMVQNKNVALNKFGNSFHAKDDIRQGWETLVLELNKIGPAKSRDSWEKTWKDTKFNVVKRYSALRQQRAKTGNNALPGDLQGGMNETDLKALSILGTDYIDGSSSCADSAPDSEDDIRALMNGDTSVLNKTTIQSSIEEELFIEDIPIVFAEDIPASSLISPNATACADGAGPSRTSTPLAFASARRTTTNNSSRLNIPNVAAEDIPASNLISPSATTCADGAGPSRTSTPLVVPNARRTTTNNPSRFRSNRDRLGVQFQEARQEFADLQKQNCEALLACAQALDKMSENEAKFLNLEAQRIELERERLEVERERTAMFGRLFSVLDKVVEKLDK